MSARTVRNKTIFKVLYRQTTEANLKCTCFAAKYEHKQGSIMFSFNVTESYHWNLWICHKTDSTIWCITVLCHQFYSFKSLTLEDAKVTKKRILDKLTCPVTSWIILGRKYSSTCLKQDYRLWIHRHVNYSIKTDSYLHILPPSNIEKRNCTQLYRAVYV